MNNKREEAYAERVWQMAGVEEEEGGEQLRDPDGRKEVKSRGGQFNPLRHPKDSATYGIFLFFLFLFFVGPPSNRS